VKTISENKIIKYLQGLRNAGDETATTFYHSLSKTAIEDSFLADAEALLMI
jgi:hypothetical protein